MRTPEKKRRVQSLLSWLGVLAFVISSCVPEENQETEFRNISSLYAYIDTNTVNGVQALENRAEGLGIPYWYLYFTQSTVIIDANKYEPNVSQSGEKEPCPLDSHVIPSDYSGRVEIVLDNSNGGEIGQFDPQDFFASAICVSPN